MKSQVNITLYEEPQALLEAIESTVIETEVILDLGCGIVPINYFRPKLHIMVEPWGEYADILYNRYDQDKSVLILKTGALEALQQFQSNSVDSIFLIDVIEHLEKNIGVKLITEMERIVRKQIVVFTPLGFMPQHIEGGEKDAWGLSGNEMQEHKSGWLPDDFPSDWFFHICKTYHKKNAYEEELDKPYGAFYAVRTFDFKPSCTSLSFSDIRRPLPSEIALERLNAEHLVVKTELAETVEARANMAQELERTRTELAKTEEARANMAQELERVRRSLLFKMLRGVSQFLGR